MADWIVDPPSRTPKFWGRATGVYSHVNIKQNNQALAETPEANRYQYIPAVGPQNWGKLDDTEQAKNFLTNLEATQGAIAYDRSELTPTWTYIEPGTAQDKPRYQLDWLIENKLTAPNVNPPILAQARGAVTGEIHHQVKSTLAEPETDYALKMKVFFKASFEQDGNATVHPTLGGRMYMACQNSNCEAKYDPVEDQWTMVRHTLQSTGQYYDRTYTWPGKSFEKIFSFYPVVTGGQALFFALQVGKIGNPQAADEGSWEGVDQDLKTTFMTSDAGHVTGLDGTRDDKWSGQIWIEPQAIIQH